MINDGDVFRWRYKDEKPDDLGAYRRYHCKSQIAIARHGRLKDTFWGSGPYVLGTYEEVERALELTLLGNLNELEKRPEYDAAYYDDDDIVDLNHSNSSRDNFYIRKGAMRSRDKMRATLSERIALLESEIASRKHSLASARDKLVAVDRGDDLNGMYL